MSLKWMVGQFAMGIESRHFLIPRPNRFRPSADLICKFVGDLMTNCWVHDPSDPSRASPIDSEATRFRGLARDTGMCVRTNDPENLGFARAPFPITAEWLERQLENDLVLMWPIMTMEQTGLRYPLRPCPDQPYYDFEFHLCRDYVYHASDCIEPFPVEVKCTCGKFLEYRAEEDRGFLFDSNRIHFNCPKCKSPFDPGGLAAPVRNGWTGEAIGLVPGGAAYRFAIIVDCGKCIPGREEMKADFDPELIALCKKSLGCDFYQLTDFY